MRALDEDTGAPESRSSLSFCYTGQTAVSGNSMHLSSVTLGIFVFLIFLHVDPLHA